MTTPEPAELFPTKEQLVQFENIVTDAKLGRTDMFHAAVRVLRLTQSTTPAAPAEDAVEALARADAQLVGKLEAFENCKARNYGEHIRYHAYYDATMRDAREKVSYLNQQGYTIRRETMTEAELEKAAWSIAGHFCVTKDDGVECVAAINNIAKKFRG